MTPQRLLRDLFSSSGGRKRSLRPSIQSAAPDYQCTIIGTKLIFTLGVARYSRILTGNQENFKRCFDKYYGIYILFSVLCFSFVLSFVVIIFLIRAKLWKSKKYSHLLYLNIMNLVLITCFTFYTLYTEMNDRVLLHTRCIIKLQVLSISFQMYFLALICLGIDCATAVIYPLKYRSASTMKRFVKLNLGIFALLLITQMFLPLLHVAFSSPNEKSHCETEVLLKMSRYYIGNQIISLIMLIAAAVVNVTIAVGIIKSMIQRKKLLSQDGNVAGKAFKLVFRVICLLGGNYACLSLIFLYPFALHFEKVTPPTVIFSTSLSVGIWNNVIFVFLDNIKNICKTK